VATIVPFPLLNKTSSGAFYRRWLIINKKIPIRTIVNRLLLRKWRNAFWIVATEQCPASMRLFNLWSLAWIGGEHHLEEEGGPYF
jgi:hypothetical protein